MIFQITPRNTFKILVIAVISLTILGSAVQFCKYNLGHDYLFGFVPLFDLSIEPSIPTWYSSITLVICSILLWIISTAKQAEQDKFAFHWRSMAVVFLCLSIDEVAGLHEIIGDLLHLDFTGDTHGFLHYTWVICGAFFVLVFAASYINFLRQLPVKTMWLFILSGIIYVGGALGMEMLNARFDELHGNKNLTYQLMTAVEEFLEMGGIAIFIYTLLSYISTQNLEMRAVSLHIEEKDCAEEA